MKAPTQARKTPVRDMLVGTISLTAVTAALLSTVTYITAARAEPAGDGEKNKAVVQEKFDAWAAGTGGPFELLTDDAQWEIVGRSAASKVYLTKEDFMSAVIRPFNARVPGGIKPKVRNIYADGETVIVFFDAQGTAKDGKTYANTYAWFLDMKDGKVSKASAFFDSIEFNDLWTRVSP